MKQITKKSIEAFLAHKRFFLVNTHVETSTEGNMSYLKLRGNCIASHNNATGELAVTVAGWNTPTTRARLNGLPGVKVYQNDGLLYLNGSIWDGIWAVIKTPTAE